jgi:ornithine carbamoyltransferase
VLGRMLHGAIIRTFAQADVEEFAKFSGLPVINALTDDEHPCQILCDLFTIGERLGDWRGKTIAFLGDGSCNVPASWLWAAKKLDFILVIGAPEKYQPSVALRARLGDPPNIRYETDPIAAVRGADVLYTDVWVSMGKEEESRERLADLRGWQLDGALLGHARPGALVLHCLPAYRGQEITEDVLEANADAIFQQAENRLHGQKAVLAWCVAR